MFLSFSYHYKGYRFGGFIVKFQILDVDYLFVNDKPIIRVFGKTAKGESVCGFYDGFSPFLYAEGDGVKELLEKDSQVSKIETVERYTVGSQKPKKIIKITTRNPAGTPDIREGLVSAGIKP